MKDTAQYLIDIPVTTSAGIFPFNNSDYNVWISNLRQDIFHWVININPLIVEKTVLSIVIGKVFLIVFIQEKMADKYD